MATINIKINNKTFPVACEDGQESLVEKAASDVNKKVEQLKALSPTAPTEYLLVLCALSMQNEIFSIQKLENEDFKNDYKVVEESLGEIASIVESLNKKLKS